MGCKSRKARKSWIKIHGSWCNLSIDESNEHRGTETIDFFPPTLRGIMSRRTHRSRYRSASMGSLGI